jgi:hypothetical protein
VRSVLICGGGVAACCCTHLLRRAGTHSIVEKVDRPRLPAIMLGQTTQKIFGDIFDRRGLFEACHRIERRVVAWVEGREPISLPHSAVVLSEEALLDRIEVRPALNIEDVPGEPEWRIITSHSSAASSAEHHFGGRMAAASPVRLDPAASADTCWIESLPSGWLFLLPCGTDRGWLLAVGGPAQSLLRESHLVVNQLAELGVASGGFPSHPRITDPLGGPGWLRCGSAALGFDPLCGDGVGHAAREAILGSAVIRSVVDGGDVNSLICHYQARLMAGFRRHLAVCAAYYRAGRRGPWWDEQVNETIRGLEWTSQQLQTVDAPRYRLKGFALEALR